MKTKSIFTALLLILLSANARSQSSNPNSPFGFIINPSPVANLDTSLNAMTTLGAQWIRLSGINGIVWNQIEQTSGNYNWTSTDNNVSKCQAKGINILATVAATNTVHNAVLGYLPSDTNAYNTFLKKAVERYDGDGINDAPGSPIIDVWQIGNEIDVSVVWLDSYYNYAELMKISYRAIKQASPNAKVAIAGMAHNFSKYSQVLGYLQDSIYFDVFDFHWHAIKGGNYRVHKTQDTNVNDYFDQYVNNIRNLLDSIGYNNAEIWITEMSISDINPAEQTENKQAIDLIKRYVYPVRKGVSVICWGTLYENNNFAGNPGNTNYFNTQGIINNPLNDGISSKKLAYYTYKKMVEKLDNVDWNNIQVIQENNNIYIYKFIINGNPIYVAWNDSSISQTVTISDITLNQAIITDAVPMYNSGAQVTNYTTAFSQDTISVIGNTLTLTLDSIPVFIEPLTITSITENFIRVQFDIFPNPSNGKFIIETETDHIKNSVIKIYNLFGEQVFQSEISNSKSEINMNLPSGIYFYKVKNNQQLISTGKLIIQ